MPEQSADRFIAIYRNQTWATQRALVRRLSAALSPTERFALLDHLLAANGWHGTVFDAADLKRLIAGAANDHGIGLTADQEEAVLAAVRASGAWETITDQMRARGEALLLDEIRAELGRLSENN